jgi:3-oxoacyl-[acyl-carrier-protein] synthase II
VTAPVVTGMAWSTPLGTDLDGVWDRLCAGATGVAPVDSPHQLRSQLAAVDPSVPYRPEAAAERQVTLAERTLAAAFADAGLAAEDPRALLVLGTSFGADLDGPMLDWTALAAKGIGHPNRPMRVTTACSAGSDAILVADALIRSGRSEICVAGGVDVLTEAKRLGHSALGTMSPSGLRAFDDSHDGMILGEGAGLLVLESAESARRRSARVYARLGGAGSANDAAGLTAPDPSGRSVVAAMRRCLDRAGVDRSDVGVVSAHGTGTQLNDEVEAASLHQLFGTKGALGHSLGATGAIEAITTILALRDKTVPPMAGLRSPLPEFTLRLPVDGPAEAPAGVGISLTLGFGGFNTCLLFSEGGWQ